MAGVGATRRLAIPADHPAFAGHFPGMPMLPGALLLDAALEVLAREQALDLRLWRLSFAKFLQVVRPGTALEVTHAPAPNGDWRITVSGASGPVLSAALVAVPAGAPRDGRAT